MGKDKGGENNYKLNIIDTAQPQTKIDLKKSHGKWDENFANLIVPMVSSQIPQAQRIRFIHRDHGSKGIIFSSKNRIGLI